MISDKNRKIKITGQFGFLFPEQEELNDYKKQMLIKRAELYLDFFCLKDSGGRVTIQFLKHH